MSPRRLLAATTLVALGALTAAGLALGGGGGGSDAYLEQSHPVTPVVLGVPEVGQTLTVVYNGEPGDGGMVVTPHQDGPYRWLRCDANGDSCALVYAGDSAQYVVHPADAGATLRAMLRTVDRGGVLWALSEPTSLVKGAAPPAQPPPAGNDPAKETALKVVAFSTAPQARAGRAFAATLRVPAGAVTERAAVGVRCAARIAGRALTATASFRNGVARCAWRLPEGAGGSRLTGVVRVLYLGSSVQRHFAARVRSS